MTPSNSFIRYIGVLVVACALRITTHLFQKALVSVGMSSVVPGETERGKVQSLTCKNLLRLWIIYLYCTYWTEVPVRCALCICRELSGAGPGSTWHAQGLWQCSSMGFNFDSAKKKTTLRTSAVHSSAYHKNPSINMRQILISLCSTLNWGIYIHWKK